MVNLTPIEKLCKSPPSPQTLNVSTFGNTADIYAIDWMRVRDLAAPMRLGIYATVHLVPHACQHIMVDPSHSSGDTVVKILTFTEHHIWYYCLLAANQGQLCVRAFPWKNSLSIGVRITMIRCVVYLLRIFKMFHGLMNNPVLLQENLTLWNMTTICSSFSVSLITSNFPSIPTVFCWYFTQLH
jgi:hypothetical protein